MRDVFCKEQKCYFCFRRIQVSREWSVPMKFFCPCVLKLRGSIEWCMYKRLLKIIGLHILKDLALK
ncbi:hypothetical protein HanIR_Chr13g0626361 [Helianthus annuus]|nr:hypothetical protein HanIR_Chr13g0626361 [Helianthus annuus]